MNKTTYNLMIEMLTQVAFALGEDLRQQFAFVGGCTTALLLTDDTSQEDVRHTDDVDLVVSLTSATEWYGLAERLRTHGFQQSPNNDDNVVCRFRLGELQVDFMPDSPEILGFTNIWYKEALEHTTKFSLSDGLTIRLLTAPYFLATKFEAFKGRGNDDLLASRDIEDICILLDGRSEVVEEIYLGNQSLKDYLSFSCRCLKNNQDYEYMIQGNLNDRQRQQRVKRVVNAIIEQWPVFQ